MPARGGLLKLLDAYIAIGGDAADFDKVVDQSEAKAKAAGGRLESAFSPRKVLGALGTAAGAVLGVTLGVAGQLDTAMRQLQADTGMTDAQAKAAEHSLAGMYKNNLQGFAQIGATMAVVINGLDLTGAAADAMTEKFLKFETATGQDSAAVSAFHEILNAWGLDASAVPHLMDLLVASHQKYGSSIADNQASLQRLAPQMKAMNMTVDDTINLLNLFDAAGLDASKAQFALNTAVKNLQPGQTFNDLIKQVTAIEDPTLRAQEAIKLFGARGGVGLANALRPGITSLADFATSASDTVGAMDKAAAAVEDSLSNRAVKALHFFQGGLADVATSMGTSSDAILMAAALLGPKFTTVLLSGLGGLGGLLVPKIVGAILGATLPAAVAGGEVGAATGTALGIAIGPAMALAIPAAIIIGLTAAKPTIQKALDDMGLHVPNLFEGQGALAPNAGIQPVGPQTTYAEGNAAAHVAALAGAAGDLSRGALAASRSTTTMGSEASKAGPKVDVLADAADRARDAMQVMGDKFKATWRSLSAAAQGAADDIFGPQIRASDLAANAREIAAQRAIIASKKSTTAEKQDARDRLLALQKEGLGIQIEMAGRGELTKAAYATLISTLQTQAKSGNAEIANSAKIALAELAQLKAAASAIPNLPAWLARSYSGSAAGGRASGGPVTGGYPYIVNENTPRSEWFVPNVSGTILTADQAAGQGLGRGGAGGGDLTVNIYPGHDTSLQTARRFGQAVLDEVAYGLREQRARSAT